MYVCVNLYKSKSTVLCHFEGPTDLIYLYPAFAKTHLFYLNIYNFKYPNFKYSNLAIIRQRIQSV